MNDADNTQEQNGTTQEGPHESTQEEQDKVPTAAKTKRNPRQPKAPKRPKDTKTNKVIAEAVGHTEYSDDQKPRTPLPDNEPPLLDMINATTPPELIGQPEAKANSKDKSKAKLVAEPSVEPIAEPVAKPIAEPVNKTTKPQRAKPVSQDPAPANVPDLEDLVMTRMKSMRDAKELAKMENIQALIAQSS